MRTGSDCIYIISQPSGTFLELQIKMLDLNAPDCFRTFKRSHETNFMAGIGSDYLEIRDGGSELAPLMGKFCGSRFPTLLQTTQSNAWMK